MSATVQTQQPLSFVRTGLIAGAIGAVTVEFFLLVVRIVSWPSAYQWIASGLVGKTAFTATGYAWLGLALHVVVALVWGLAYAAAAQRVPALRNQVVLAGLIYGIIVLVAMQIVEMAAHLWAAPSPLTLVLLVVDHTVFFGLPVAWYVGAASSERR